MTLGTFRFPSPVILMPDKDIRDISELRALKVPMWHLTD